MILEEYIFGIILILIRLPPFYFVPSFGLLSLSHNISRLLIVVLFLYILFFKKKRQFILVPHTTSLLLSIFVISQSLSIIFTINVQSFLATYKDFIFGILLFYISFELINKKNIFYIITMLLCVTFVQLLYELTFFFAPSFIFTYMKPFLYEKYWFSLIYQSNRIRYFGDTFDEVFVYLITWQYFRSKHKPEKIISTIFFLGIIFITFISNWRTKNLLLIISIISSYFIFIKKIGKESFLFSNPIDSFPIYFI